MKLRTVLLIWLVALSSCNRPGDSAAVAHPKVIAVATLMSHPSLDEVRSGLTEGLRSEGLVEGRDYRILDRNANGQIELTGTIAAELEARSPDVIVPITTPMAQAVHARTSRPLVFAAVTDPVSAGIVRSLDGTPRITGTSDAWPYRQQLELIRQIQPQARRLAVLYNPGEAASQFGIRQIRAAAIALNFTLVEVPVSSSNEMATAARQAARQADALFLSSDNTVISAVPAAFAVAVQSHIPLYVGDSGTVEKGGLAAASVGYRALGRETGRLVARVLRGEDRIPVFVGTDAEISVNARAAQLMGVQVPPSVLARARHVYNTIRQ